MDISSTIYSRMFYCCLIYCSQKTQNVIEIFFLLISCFNVTEGHLFLTLVKSILSLCVNVNLSEIIVSSLVSFVLQRIFSQKLAYNNWRFNMLDQKNYHFLNYNEYFTRKINHFCLSLLDDSEKGKVKMLTLFH